MLFAIGGLANRKIAALALLALAADDGEGNDDAITLLEPAVHARTGLDHLSHHLVTHDVAWQHRRDEIVEQMKVGTADRAARHLDDRVTGILDFRIRHRVASNVLLAVPDERSHVDLLVRVLEPLSPISLEGCRQRLIKIISPAKAGSGIRLAAAAAKRELAWRMSEGAASLKKSHKGREFAAAGRIVDRTDASPSIPTFHQIWD